MLWFEHEAWFHALKTSISIRLHDLPEQLLVKPVSYWALRRDWPDTRQSAFVSQPAARYSVYIDGSCNGVTAAWSLVVTACFADTEVFVGATFGQVSINPDDPRWVGADTVDNISAELNAMVIALATCHAWNTGTPVCIRPDLSLSRMLTQASSTCRSNKRLAQLCQALGLWTAATVQVQEIRGHQNDPWNELADTLARFALHQPDMLSSGEIAALHALAKAPHDAAWTWMQTVHPSLAACFPPMIDQQILTMHPPQRQLQICPLERLEQHLPSASDMVAWEMTVVSANVLALELWSKHTNGTRRSGQRTVRLDDQWHKQHAHVIGVQEARTRAGQYHTQHYRIFSSGADFKQAPAHGCELWLHKHLPIAELPDGTPITWSDAKITTAHADPRRLFVRATLGHTPFAFVVLHTPCSHVRGSADSPEYVA